MVDSITVFYIVSILGPLVLHVCLPFLDTSQGNSETGPAPSGLARTSVRLAAHALTASVFLAIATHDDDGAAKSGASLLATYHFFIAIHGIFFVLLCTTKRFDPYYSFLSYLKHANLETAILDLVLFVGLIVKNRVAEPVRWLIPRKYCSTLD